MQEAEYAVRYNLLDPYGAQTREIRVVTNSYGDKSVCGQLNGKNIKGGFTGFTKFVYFKNKGYLEPIAYESDPEDFKKVYIASGCAGPELEVAARKIKEQREEQARLKREARAEKVRIQEQAKIDKAQARAEQKKLDGDAKAQKILQITQANEEKKRLALQAKEEKINFEKNKESLKQFCDSVYNYYLARVSNQSTHEEAFTPIKNLASTIDLKLVLGDLTEIEKLLMSKATEYESSIHMDQGFKKNGTAFRTLIKADCVYSNLYKKE
ncbi:hypothetical protein [Acinetobacter wanghuae]|uniref:hypothetical protein n=1 Tax=Acinetobacter wanghuae TaxID=2662362 RepID=UPI003AF66845